MRYRFLIIAAVLIVVALFGFGGQTFISTPSGVAPINVFDLLTAGLAIAGGLSLIADAIRERNDC